MAWVEANAFPAPGKARNPAASDFNAAECSATNFQYRRSKRGSTSQEKPIIAPPIREFFRGHPGLLSYYATNVEKDV
jgi:hypothetical protein